MLPHTDILPPTAPMPPHRLLVIDDDAPTGTLFRRVAEREGYEVRVCGSASEGQQSVGEFDPHVILLDLIMPDVDGIEMVRWLTGVGYRGRVVMVSGYSDSYLDAAVTMLQARGIRDSHALSKPVDIARLREVLKDPPAIDTDTELI